MRRFLMTTTAAIACLAPPAALAQSQSGQPPVAAGETTQTPDREVPESSSDAGPDASSTSVEGADTSAPTGLADIIVTAQRRAESSQRAAIAVDVVTGSDVTAAGINDARDLSKLVPALSIQQIGTSNASFIRGVGNFSVSVTADPTVAFNYDGVYIGRQQATAGTFYDLDRVEVLKGPQGTLYGRNATAGVINVLPTQPKLGEFGGYATVSYGNYNALLAEGAINVALGSRAALRVSGTITDRDGFLNDGTSDNKTHGVRVQLKAEPTPDLTVRIAADYTHLGGRGPGFTWVDRQIPVGGFAGVRSQNFTIIPTGFSFSEGPGSPRSQAFFTSLPAGGGAGIPGRLRDPFPRLFQDSDFFGVNADIIYDTGFGTLTIIPAFRWDNIRNVNGAGGFPIGSTQKDEQFSVEARFAGTVSLFDYTLGGFFYDENNEQRQGTVTFGSNYSAAAPTKQHVTSYAPFARVAANLTEQLRLVGGIRYTRDKKRLNAQAINITPICTRTAAAGGCPNIVLPPPVVGIEGLPFPVPAFGAAPTVVPANGASYARLDTFFNSKVTNSKVTWRGAVEFDVAPASLLYASVETGFRSGGFNTLVGFETFEPEYITAYTVGSKNRFLDNRIQLNVEAFWWKYRNQQTSHPSLDITGRPGSLTENIGRSTIKGVEVDGRFLVTPTTVISSTVAYLDAENKEFVFVLPTQLGTLTGCAVTPVQPVPPPPAPGRITVDCTGKPSFNAPKWSINLAGEQTIPLGDYSLVLGADTQYKSSRFLGVEYQPQQRQGESWITNAQVSFGPADRQWSLSGFVRNIENNRLLNAPFVFGGVSIAYTGAPRTYGVRASVKF